MKEMVKRVCLVVFVAVAVVFSQPAVAEKAISFVDLSGRTVTLEKPAERIVVIPIPWGSLLMALDGSADRLVAWHPSSKVAYEEGLLKKIFPEAAKIRTEVVGKKFMPNVEEVLTLKPDLVFQWGHKGKEIMEPLTNAGMTVALGRYGTQEYIEKIIMMMGRAIGKEDRAKTMLAWHNASMTEITKKVAAISLSERPRVLLFYKYRAGLQVYGGETYADFCFNLTGGINVVNEIPKFPKVNEEQVIAWDPEVILLSNFDPVTPAEIYRNAKLAGVSAVKNKRVYKIPLGGYRWGPPNQESPLMWKWLTMIFHPDKFSWPLREEMAEKYRFLYGYNLSEKDTDAVLRLDIMNKSAANYVQFAGQ